MIIALNWRGKEVTLTRVALMQVLSNMPRRANIHELRISAWIALVRLTDDYVSVLRLDD